MARRRNGAKREWPEVGTALSGNGPKWERCEAGSGPKTDLLYACRLALARHNIFEERKRMLRIATKGAYTHVIRYSQYQYRYSHYRYRYSHYQYRYSHYRCRYSHYQYRYSQYQYRFSHFQHRYSHDRRAPCLATTFATTPSKSGLACAE
jgi:hypothetical protein